METASRQHLESRGLRFLQKNFRSKYGELDLIMMDNQDLVFVEVRYRKNDLFGGAAQSINAQKQLKLRRTAESFLQKYATLKFDGCRFDVVAVSGNQSDYKFDWICDAF